MRNPVAEMHVARTAAQFPSRDRWRWDITWQRPIDGPNPGVKDRRWHLRGDCGYTVTKRGAWRAVRLAYEQPPYEETAQ